MNRWRSHILTGQQPFQLRVNQKAVFFKKIGKFHRQASITRKYSLRRSETPLTTYSRCQPQTAQRLIFHPPSSAKSPRVLPPLPAGSGTRAKALRLLRTISSRRPARVVGFPACAPLPPAVPATFRNPPSSPAPLLFSQREYSRVSSPPRQANRNSLASSHSKPRLRKRTNTILVRRLQSQRVLLGLRFRRVRIRRIDRLAIQPVMKLVRIVLAARLPRLTSRYQQDRLVPIR